jgi:hypothetical protein
MIFSFLSFFFLRHRNFVPHLLFFYFNIFNQQGFPLLFHKNKKKELGTPNSLQVCRGIGDWSWRIAEPPVVLHWCSTCCFLGLVYELYRLTALSMLRVTLRD